METQTLHRGRLIDHLQLVVKIVNYDTHLPSQNQLESSLTD